MRQIAIAVVLLISLLATSCSAISDSPYTEKEFTVGEGEKYTIVADLEAGQTIEGDFSISGEENYIDFYIMDPSGGLLYSVTAEGGHEFTAEAKYSGAHTLYFDNSYTFGTSRQIILRYRIR